MLQVKDIERILKNTFSFELLEATLTQELSEAPVVYKGSGNITQQGDGSLILNLYQESLRLEARSQMVELSRNRVDELSSRDCP